MTEIVIAKVGTPVALAGAASLALIDPSITNIALGLITALSSVAALHYGYKTAALNKKLVEKDALLKALEAAKVETKEKEKIP